MPLLKKKKENIYVNGFPMILGYLGFFMMAESLITIFPLVILAFYPNEAGCWKDFVIPSAGSLLIGLILYLAFLAGRKPGKLFKNQESVMLILLWLSAVAVGAFPFYVSSLFGEMNMTYIESFFEAMSGYSTTGLTVLPSECFLGGTFAYSHVFLFHRAWLQFIGGVGLVLIFTSLIHDKNNAKLFSAEGHNDHLLPNIAKTARWIFLIYIVYIALGTVALWIIGMDPFEALCHAISSLATGGFSTRSEGLLYWQVGANALSLGRQIAMEIVLGILMLLGSTSFVIHFLLFTVFAKPYERGFLKKRLGATFRDFELRFALIFLLILTALATTGTWVYVNQNLTQYGDYLVYAGTDHLTFLEAFRYNLFYLVSALSTTGYANSGPLAPATGSLTALGDFAIIISIFAMSVGGASGSTAGGIKQWRFGISLKDFIWSWTSKSKNERTVSTHQMTHHGEIVEITDSDKTEAHNYILLYIVTLVLGSCVLAILPYVDFRSAIYNFASALSTFGLGVFEFDVNGTVVHTFTEYRDTLTAAGESLAPYNVMLVDCTVGMMFARLEIFICIYAVKGMIFDPIARRMDSGRYRGLVYRLKKDRTSAISHDNMVKAEAISEVLREYEKLSKAVVEKEGTHGKLTRQEIIESMEKKRDKMLELSNGAENPELKAKYTDMATIINGYLPRNHRL